ncbi:hypothetical protein V5O48_014762 [Marasmius crinis-equi]|uniref:CxC2-like cysteine cluster KDZ transposase-associated domain-containing protein n=1 Tax=Marasmius crinis-equi TaxID=585013 RepID=A0ABR3EWF5_9AGAR
MSKKRKGNVYHDRIELQGDKEIVRSREEALGKSGQKVVIDRSPGKGRNPWTNGRSWQDWKLDERPDFALDDASEGYSTLVDADIFDERIFLAHCNLEGGSKGSKRKRSVRAVRPNIFWAQNHRDAFKVSQYIQLLRRRLYPASTKDGRITTCATFEFLDSLQLHTFTAKSSTYDYYRATELQTDGAGERVPSSRYRPLMRMIRQWCFLHMIIRSGAGHELETVMGDASVEGRLIPRCPSCPHPGVNLPRGWNVDTPENRFLYHLRVCMDANFRLKEQLVSSHSRDPALTDGLGYFVKRKPYDTWVDSKGDSDEISSCVPFAALTKQNTKFLKGLRYTGVGGVSCSRSEMVLKLANLKKGERYSTMDYLFGVVMNMYALLTWVMLMYDICCQWIAKMDRRMSEWPPAAFVQRLLNVIPGVGKLYEPGHKQENHEQFLLNLVLHAANTDGEAQERIWAEHNKLANSSKTMGPGSRQDFLEACFGFWNWLKYISMGSSLRIRHAKAVKDRNLQREAHEGLTENIPETLEGMCAKWEQAPWPKANVFNPFEVVEEYQSQADCLRELALEDEQHLKNGGTVYPPVSPSAFVVLVLDIRDAQRKLKDQVKAQTRDPTSRQTTKIIEQRNTICQMLMTLESLRHVYMPVLARFIEEANLPDMNLDVHPEDAVLYLPSDLPEEGRGRLCVAELVDIEAKLQQARCMDSLHGLRHTLRVKSRMILFKNTNVRGQKESGRSREVINRVVFQARAFAESYRESRAAYQKLVGGGAWESQLRVLKDSDVRSLRDPALVHVGPGRRGTAEEEDDESPTEPEPTQEENIDLIRPDRSEWEHRTKHGTGETRRLVLWIWTAGGRLDLEDGADENGNEVLRSEWCKSRARLHRAEEEVKLVKEEMRRTLEYLTWSASEWEKVPASERCSDLTLKEGMVAYRKCQARTQPELRASFRDSWQQPLSEMELLEETPVNEEEGTDSARGMYHVASEDGEEEGEEYSSDGEDVLGEDYDMPLVQDSDDSD